MASKFICSLVEFILTTSSWSIDLDRSSIENGMLHHDQQARAGTF